MSTQLAIWLGTNTVASHRALLWLWAFWSKAHDGICRVNGFGGANGENVHLRRKDGVAGWRMHAENQKRWSLMLHATPLTRVAQRVRAFGQSNSPQLIPAASKTCGHSGILKIVTKTRFVSMICFATPDPGAS